MEIAKAQEQLVADVGAMTETAHRVQGAAFANTVTAMYALLGMEELGKRLAYVSPDLANCVVTMSALAQRVGSQLLECIPEPQHREAIDLAARMNEKQIAMHNLIFGSMQ